MWINPTEEIVDLDGKPIPLAKGSDKPLILSGIIVDVLMTSFRGDENKSGDEKIELFDLAEKFHGATMPVDVSLKEADLILTRAAVGLPTLVYARVRKAIERARNGYSDRVAA